MINLYVFSKILSAYLRPSSAREGRSVGLVSLIALLISNPAFSQSSSQQQVSTVSLPPVQMVDSSSKDPSPAAQSDGVETQNDNETTLKDKVQEESDTPIKRPSRHPQPQSKCERYVVNNDLEQRFEALREQMERDYKSGLPNQIRQQLVDVRRRVDVLMNELFEMDSSNSQEVNHVTQQTINHLETMISLIPKANSMAPKVLTRYMVPFTNLSSIKAEQQDCLMKTAIEEARNNKQKSVASSESSINIYKRLSSQLEEMNKNLYRLQTSDVSRFIGLRAQLIKNLEQYNKDSNQQIPFTANIPNALNQVHTEIEKLMPGLELPKKYYSLAQ